MKVKRTYNLGAETVATVRELVEQRHLASSQDALVEMALADFFLTARHAEDARRFASAAQDPEITGELASLEQEFRAADRETWPE
jgi:hypothetical protein